VSRTPQRPRAATPGPAVGLTAVDLVVLGFVAEHRLVLSDHVAALLNRSRRTASARLHALTGPGYLREVRVFDRHPPSFLITRTGLNVIGSTLPTPRMDLRGYTHDVGLAWLWLAARCGSFGGVTSIYTERRLRSRDAATNQDQRPLAIRLGGFGGDGRGRLHYPDLLLIATDGRRIALELELSWKSRGRREDILTAYAFDNRVASVVYFVEDRRLGRSIADSARRLGMSGRVHVQPVRVTGRPGVHPSVAASRVRAAPGMSRGADAVRAEVVR